MILVAQAVEHIRKGLLEFFLARLVRRELCNVRLDTLVADGLHGRGSGNGYLLMVRRPGLLSLTEELGQVREAEVGVQGSQIDQGFLLHGQPGDDSLGVVHRGLVVVERRDEPGVQVDRQCSLSGSTVKQTEEHLHRARSEMRMRLGAHQAEQAVAHRLDGPLGKDRHDLLEQDESVQNSVRIGGQG